jgi:hypothetical protein
VVDGEGWRARLLLLVLERPTTSGTVPKVAARRAAARRVTSHRVARALAAEDGKGWIPLQVKAGIAARYRASLRLRQIVTVSRLMLLPNQQDSAKLPRSNLSGFHPRSYGIGGHPAGHGLTSMADLAARIRVAGVAVGVRAAAVVGATRRAISSALYKFVFPQPAREERKALRAVFLWSRRSLPAASYV